MLSIKKTLLEKESIFLGKWRNYDLLLVYDKDGNALFYSLENSKEKHQIYNKEVIEIIVDTCLDIIARAALKFSKDYDTISYVGRWEDVDYWYLSNSSSTVYYPSLPHFVSFDGRKFNLITQRYRIDLVLGYFARDHYKSQSLIATGYF